MYTKPRAPGVARAFGDPPAEPESTRGRLLTPPSTRATDHHEPFRTRWEAEPPILGCALSVPMTLDLEAPPAFTFAPGEPAPATPPRWAARSRCIADVDFLARASAPGDLVAYAVEAPKHLALLHDLFPDLSWNIYSAKPVALAAPNVTVHGAFTDADPPTLRNRNVVFICTADLGTQRRWYTQVSPKAALLSVRSQRELTYLDGELRLPAWGAYAGTETYLVPSGETRLRKWPMDAYRNHVYSYNTYQRFCKYLHGVTTPSLDACADCAHEVQTWRAYLRRVGRPQRNDSVAALVERLTAVIEA
jgi:hypothetical protein